MVDARGGMLVLGAGELGSAVLQALLPQAASAGINVDVMVRSGCGRSADAIRALGACVVESDIAAVSEEALATTFARYDSVLSCIGFGAGPGTQLKLARAALASRVRRYFPWQFGVDYDALGRGSPQPLFDEQLDVRDLLRGQNRTRWVIISVGMFTSFLFEPSFGVVNLAEARVRALGGWDNAVTVTTPEDIARMTVAIVMAKPEFADEVIHVAGDTLTYGALADLVETALVRRVKREIWSLPDLIADLAQAPDDALRRYRAVFAGGRGMSWNKADSFNVRYAYELTDTATWLNTNLRAH